MHPASLTIASIVCFDFIVYEPSGRKDKKENIFVAAEVPNHWWFEYGSVATFKKVAEKF